VTTPTADEYHDAGGSSTTVTITGTTLLQNDTINFHANEYYAESNAVPW
jgi:hypothetical protein